MDIKKLHEKFKDNESPSVEGQMRWLEKQGFQKHQIEQAVMATYHELDQGRIPKRWKYITKKENGSDVIKRAYLPNEHKGPGGGWQARDIKNGFELDQFLLTQAKQIRTAELEDIVSNLQMLMDKFKSDWKKSILNKRPWYKRILGIKAAIKEEAAKEQ